MNDFLNDASVIAAIRAHQRTQSACTDALAQALSLGPFVAGGLAGRLRAVDDAGGGGGMPPKGANTAPATPLNTVNPRHYIKNVTQKSLTKDVNTVVEPWVDVQAEVAAVNAGQAQRVGQHYIVNGRTYGVHNGTLHPVSGPGFHQLDRGAYKALAVYNKFGNTPRAVEILDRMQSDPPARSAALKAWEATQGGP